MKRKNDWEKRKPVSASISLKKTVNISVEDELNHFRALLNLGGYTELYKEFLLKRLKLDEYEFDGWILDVIHKKAKIDARQNSKEFRKFLAEKIVNNAITKEQKKRWEEYLTKQDYL